MPSVCKLIPFRNSRFIPICGIHFRYSVPHSVFRCRVLSQPTCSSSIIIQQHFQNPPFSFCVDMFFYRCFLTFPMFITLLLECYCDDECQYNKDCITNGTKVCCHMRTRGSVCRKTCQDESCDVDWDCGTDQNFICCSNHVCKNSDDMCSDGSSLQTWVVVVIVLAVVCAVFGISATIFCIYRRHSIRYNDI